LVGATVAGKYTVEAWRAAGGMGVIYAARQQPLDREVAIKVLNLRDDEVDPEFEKRFYLEAATCAKLSHPNIVVVHDYGRLEPEQGGACFMVMELVHGRTIGEAIGEDGPFNPGRALRIARDIARALRAAHRHGVIHRDLKPANVMLETSDDGERVKVLDFGLVKVLQEESEQITQEGEFLGSPRFMAPEQIAHAEVDTRTDVYSLGGLLYLLLTGKPPFVRSGSMNTILAHMEDPVPPMSDHGVDIPASLEQVTRRCLEKDPKDRYASADELLGALAEVWAQLQADPEYSTFDPWRSTISTDAIRLRTMSGESIRPPSLAPPPQSDGTRRVALGLVGVGVAALAIVSGIAIERRMRPPLPVHAPAQTVAVSVEAPTPPAPAPPVPVEEPDFYSLLVESTPSRAELSRNGVVVGLTPIAIELDTEELEGAPVTLALALSQHYPFAWTQGPLGRDGRIQANLVPASRARRPAPRPRVEPSAEPTAEEPSPAEVPATADPTVLPWARPNPY